MGYNPFQSGFPFVSVSGTSTSGVNPQVPALPGVCGIGEFAVNNPGDVTVTHPLVTANSIVFAIIRVDQNAVLAAACTPGNGNFRIRTANTGAGAGIAAAVKQFYYVILNPTRA